MEAELEGSWIRGGLEGREVVCEVREGAGGEGKRAGGERKL